MDSEPGRLEKLTDASREMAAELEALRASVVSLQARVDSTESQLTESEAAQTRTASALERWSSRLTHFESLEGRLSQLRTEVAEELESIQRDIRTANEEQRKRLTAESDVGSRRVAAIEARIRDLESLRDQISAATRRTNEISSQVSGVESRLDEFSTQRTAIEESVRYSEERVASRITALERALNELASELDAWQDRIEAHDRVVRESRALAAEMEGEVEVLRREQHEVAEAQRIWEGRIDSIFDHFRAEADERWAGFNRVRQQEWAELADQNSERDESMARLQSQLANVVGRIDELIQSVDARLDQREQRLNELRHNLLSYAERISRQTAELASDVESALPPHEQPSRQEEKRQAVRREVRARRGSGSR